MASTKSPIGGESWGKGHRVGYRRRGHSVAALQVKIIGHAEERHAFPGGRPGHGVWFGHGIQLPAFEPALPEALLLIQPEHPQPLLPVDADGPVVMHQHPAFRRFIRQQIATEKQGIVRAPDQPEDGRGHIQLAAQP